MLQPDGNKDEYSTRMCMHGHICTHRDMQVHAYTHVHTHTYILRILLKVYKFGN